MQRSAKGIAALGLVTLVTHLALIGGRAHAADSADLAAVSRVLRERPGEDPREERDIARELAALGSGAVPELLALVNGRATRWLVRENERGTTRWAVGPDRFGALARSALGRLPPEEVLRHISTANIEDDADRVAALQVLAELGSARGLATVMEIGSGFDTLALRSHAVGGVFEKALTTILQNDPDSWSRIEGPLLRLSPELRAAATRALLASDRPEAARALARLLGRDAELDPELLHAISRLVRRHAWRAPEVAADVRAYLADDREELRAAGVRAIARMGDVAVGTDELHTLVERLEDPAPSVSAAALEALGELSGTSIPSDPAAWRAWLTDEEGWWLRERERLATALTGDDPATVLAAVRELAEHPALRAETGPLLTHVLGSGEPACVAAASAAVAGMGYAQAVPALGLLLFETDPRTRQAAWEALRVLTGDDLPLDGLVWDERIRG